MLLSHVIFEYTVIRLDLLEKSMPTGSKNSDVLLGWILDSLGLVKRKIESWGEEEEFGALHRIMSEALLLEPLKGWDIKTLGDVCGLSQTGMHHQMLKLRESGLISSENYGRWHIYVLRGGTITSAINLMAVQAKEIIELRLLELSSHIKDSEKRMEIPSESIENNFKIRISEPSAIKIEEDKIDVLLDDLGLNGDRAKVKDDLAKRVFKELAESSNPITILSLSDKFSESRSRIRRTIDRFRNSNIIERVPMLDRIAQDIYIGMTRQYEARGEKWLFTRGGFGRINEEIAIELIDGIKNKNLDSDKVQQIILPLSIEKQKILLNTLGGRMPYGYRIKGRNGEEMKENVMRSVDRTLLRLKTVAERLEKSIIRND
jgi:DNA-binding transcriptional ArsR family regulator